MRSKEEVKFVVNNLIENLKSMAEEFEELLAEIDNMSADEFYKKAEQIEDTYSKHGIELF